MNYFDFFEVGFLVLVIATIIIACLAWSIARRTRTKKTHVQKEELKMYRLTEAQIQTALSLNRWGELCRRYEIQQGFAGLHREVGTVLMLIVCELAEAMEEYRKRDETNMHEEIADALIRIFSFCNEHRINMEAEVARKMRINLRRPYLHGKQA